MNIGYLGAGNWGYSLARILAQKGHTVTMWSQDAFQIDYLNQKKDHPRLKGYPPLPSMRFTTDLEGALKDADLLIESVTSSGLRPVFHRIQSMQTIKCPIVITSKGIEQETLLTLPDVLVDVCGQKAKPLIGALSGPGFAQEVIQKKPTSLVATAFDPSITSLIQSTFSLDFFRVYPNQDILGVCLGGALKNVISIAVGISEGLNFGESAKASLMTRGLHEIRKLAEALGAKKETLYGLSGMGDLILTASSLMSRNTLFGKMLSQGKSKEEAFLEIGMVVEGASTCEAALQLAKREGIEMPITEGICLLLSGELHVSNVIDYLMSRAIKEEHL